MQEIKKQGKKSQIFSFVLLPLFLFLQVKINLSTLVCTLVISLYFSIKILFFGAVVLSLFYFQPRGGPHWTKIMGDLVQ